jgi:hypothetical protein
VAVGLAGLMLASCTPTGVGGLPSRPVKESKVVAFAVPMSLTASDGTGLKLVSLKARAVVEEPLAFTELHLVFENPTDRTIEGRFEINMPTDAAISRFAMKIFGSWQEGEVVERRAAQVAFEDALHRKQDPALLENKAGNSFSARVFPILPRERKELIVSYSQELPSSAEPYRLPLVGLPELAELDASVILREPNPAKPGVSSSLATTSAADPRHRAQEAELDARPGPRGPQPDQGRCDRPASRQPRRRPRRTGRRDAPGADRWPHRAVRHQRLAGPSTSTARSPTWRRC